MSSILKSSHKRRAAALGKRVALDEILYGATEPGSPLSGEFADGLTPYDVATETHFPHEREVVDAGLLNEDDYSDLLDDLCDVFEQAYGAKFAQVEECVHYFGNGMRISAKSTCAHCGVSVNAGSNLI